ncbi:MAG: hypothetical protein JNK05_01730 [Myxococcales bacterium]|nr:hypothetical protein [Myxococcales bacterium]
MSTMLRACSSVAIACALVACSPPEMPNPQDVRRNDASDSATPVDTGVPPTDGSNPPADSGVPMGDGGGGTCGSAYSPCDPVRNTGCMAGQMCVIMDAMARRSTCVAAGRVAFGSACMSANDCAEGLGCIGGKCARWCCGSGDNTSCRDTSIGGRPGATCDINVTNTGLFACSVPDNCDVHRQNCMTAGDNCYPISMDGTTQCVTPEAGAMPGASCMFRNDCPSGHICVGTMMMSTCRRVCDPTNMATGTFAMCPAGMMCQRVGGLPMNIGVCGTMM